jgi:hypothetical protein
MSSIHPEGNTMKKLIAAILVQAAVTICCLPAQSQPQSPTGSTNPGLVWNATPDSTDIILDSYATDAVIAVATFQGLAGMNPADGKTIWKHSYPKGKCALGLSVMNEGVAVYWTYWDEELRKGKSDSVTFSGLTALDLKTGHVLWRLETDACCLAKDIRHGRLYVTSAAVNNVAGMKSLSETQFTERGGCNVSCYDLLSGRQIWSTAWDTWTVFIGEDADLTFLASYHEQRTLSGALGAITGQKKKKEPPVTDLMALDSQTGNARWTFKAGIGKSAQFATVVPFDTFIVGLSTGNEQIRSFKLNRSDGTVLAKGYFPGKAYYIVGDTLWAYSHSVTGPMWMETKTAYRLSDFKKLGMITLDASGMGSILLKSVTTIATSIPGAIFGQIMATDEMFLAKALAGGLLLPFADALREHEMITTNELMTRQPQDVIFSEQGLFQAKAGKKELELSCHNFDTKRKPRWSLNVSTPTKSQTNPFLLSDTQRSRVVMSALGGIWAVDPQAGASSMTEISPISNRETVALYFANGGLILVTTSGVSRFRS